MPIPETCEIMTEPIRFDPSDALLLVVDLQEKLLPAIAEQERVTRRCETMIRAARLLNVPIVWTEQYRKGLGPTVGSMVMTPIARSASGLWATPPAAA